MAITDKEKGVWGLDQTFNKINQGSIWEYNAPDDPGQLLMWGSNNKGQLGQGQGPGELSYVSSPVQIPGSWTKIYRMSSSDSSVSMASKTSGDLWVWGDNTGGALGQNQGEDILSGLSSPTQIPGTTWSKVINADKQTIALKTDGTLWNWGDNAYGDLGHNDRADRSSPVQLASKAGTTWTKIAAGNTAQLAINSAGELYAWGRYYYGAPYNLALNPSNRSSPVQIPGTNWAWVNYSSSVGVAIKTDGTLWTWGANNHGSLGINEQGDWPAMTTSRSSPVQVPGTTWSKAYSNSTTVYAFKTDGTLWGWGGNDSGDLGLNNRTSYSSPVQLPGTWSTAERDFAAGYSPIAIKTNGTLWQWGRGADAYGNNANSVGYYISSPTQIGSASNWKEAQTGGWHSKAMAITD